MITWADRSGFGREIDPGPGAAVHRSPGRDAPFTDAASGPSTCAARPSFSRGASGRAAGVQHCIGRIGLPAPRRPTDRRSDLRYNLSDKPAHGRLVAAVPDRWQAELPQEVAIAPGERKELLLRLTASPAPRRPRSASPATSARRAAPCFPCGSKSPPKLETEGVMGAPESGARDAAGTWARRNCGTICWPAWRASRAALSSCAMHGGRQR